jgi:carbon monoxide dehydrogenase subunit G
MASRVRASSRRGSGGRLLVTAAALFFVLLQASRGMAEQSAANVTVREEKGVYTVSARFEVAQPPSVALAVLTDYEQIPRFMPDVEASVVRERGAGGVVVEQEAVARLMMFSKRLHLVLEIEERPDALIFNDRCGLSFVRYEGAWRLSQHDGHTTITYELAAEPSFDVPAFVLKRLLRRDSGRMIEGLQREIAARAALRAGLTPQTVE